MLLPESQLTNTPVMSIHTGSQIGRFDTPVIDPSTMKVVAYKLKPTPHSKVVSFLRIADIREMSSLGMIIDDADEIINLGDVIKIDELHELNFRLTGKNVVDEHEKSIGKIEDYSIDSDTFMIQKLHVKQGWIRRLSGTTALVDRSQIVEVNDAYVVVKSTAQRQTLNTEERTVQQAKYVNPFRKPSASPQPETQQQ